MSPRILVILPRIPVPSRDGAEVVMSELLRGFVELGQNVDIFALNPTRQERKPEALQRWCRAYSTIEVDTVVRIGALLRHLIIPKRVRVGNVNISLSYWLSRFVSDDAMRALTSFIETHGPYDIVHCETLFTTVYGMHARTLSPRSAIIYRSHNVEWRIQDRLSREVGASMLSRIVRKRLAGQTREYESHLAESIDAIACISRLDESWYQQAHPGAAITTVLPSVAIPYVGVAHLQVPVIGFLGSLDWEPNRSAVEWFVGHVFPLIRQMLPTAEFHIAGRGSEYFAADIGMPEGVRCSGEVPSVGSFYASVNIVVAPLFSGSGVRIKLLEAFAHGKAVVTTPQGAEGVEGLSSKECVIAVAAADFAKQCVRLLENHTDNHAMGIAARELVWKAYSSQASTSKMVELYKETLKRF